MTPPRETLDLAEASGSPSATATVHRSIEAVLLGTNDDTRLLLRGLLRLHHHRVVLEAKSLDDLRDLKPATGPRVLIQDVDADDDRWSEELAAALREHPEFRAVVLLPAEGGGLRAEALRVGARAVVIRPFAIRELVRLVDEAADGSAPIVESDPDQHA
jgi:DNA-binding NarL/FixJ family response regulator